VRAAASRRAFLAGATTASACLAQPSFAAPVPAGDRVDPIFRRWLAVQDEMAAATGYTDEWIDAMDRRHGSSGGWSG